VSHCSVLAAADLESVALDAISSGYLDLIYLIQFSGKFLNGNSLSGDWNISAAGMIGSFTVSRIPTACDERNPSAVLMRRTAAFHI
jgi:hypothetical protein